MVPTLTELAYAPYQSREAAALAAFEGRYPTLLPVLAAEGLRYTVEAGPASEGRALGLVFTRVVAGEAYESLVPLRDSGQAIRRGEVLSERQLAEDVADMVARWGRWEAARQWISAGAALLVTAAVAVGVQGLSRWGLVRSQHRHFPRGLEERPSEPAYPFPLA